MTNLAVLYVIHTHTHTHTHTPWASQVVLVVNDPPANARDIRGVGSIPGSGRSPGGGLGNPLHCIFAWRIPWTEDPGGLQSQRVRHNLSNTHIHTHTHTDIYKHTSIHIYTNTCRMPWECWGETTNSVRVGGGGGWREERMDI